MRAIIDRDSIRSSLPASLLVLALFSTSLLADPDPAETPAASTTTAETVAPATTNATTDDSLIDRVPRFGPGQAAITGSGARSTTTSRPGFKLLRYDEDYRFLRDPSRRTDPLDPLKWIPLDESGEQYLSLGGEVREWFESTHDNLFGLAPANPQGYDTIFHQRYMLHADWHLNDRWRVFTQAFSGFEDGATSGPRPDIDVNRFDLHQGFVDSTWDLDDVGSVTWRLGRQEFAYGSGRLIDVREGPNLRRSFDAVRALSTLGKWKLDGWWGKPVRNNPGVFDDDPSTNVSFWGLYGVRPIGTGELANVDCYYIGYNNDQARFNTKSGHELRHSIGTRLWGRPLPWEYNLEYVYQFGDFGSGRIRAWTAANAIRYHLDDWWLKPHPGIRFDFASGDQNAAASGVGTFNPLFPSGAYFNLAGPFGPLNMIDLHPTLDLQLAEKVNLTADWNFFWRESLNDGVYSLSGQMIAPGNSTQSRYIGSSPSVTCVWTPYPHWTVLASYVHVFPGEFLKQATPGKPVDYVACWLTFKF